ncbi:MAG: helix-turn-helix transcriptional regulator, partial [Clostridia bacterium]|nr:helix-turn-helix transcriptional regulator [Clostridia bacterium]
MSDFPRMITLLRKERGLSQKQVALELDVSQALLSHYEKGIRECGLDFVVKMA